jgi:hypothetical protein
MVGISVILNVKADHCATKKTQRLLFMARALLRSKGLDSDGDSAAGRPRNSTKFRGIVQHWHALVARAVTPGTTLALIHTFSFNPSDPRDQENAQSHRHKGFPA